MEIGWGTAEEECARRLVELAIAEDLNQAGDVTSEMLIPATMEGKAYVVAREGGTIAGLPVLQMVYQEMDPAVDVRCKVEDGQNVLAQTVLTEVEGCLRSILTGERTALNFLQRLCGIASLTSRYVSLIADLPCQILDTRKTTPAWRRLEKYAVRCGGANNHRMGLFDGILIKDNHLAALSSQSMSITDLIAHVRKQNAKQLPIEIEVDNLEQLEQALLSDVDRILLDNFTTEMLSKGVALRNQINPGIQLEASGGVTLSTLRGVAETGVDYISIGALTHSAKAMEVALEYSLSLLDKYSRICVSKRIGIMASDRSLSVHLVPHVVSEEHFQGSITIIIDVLRASTTIIHALAAGCKAILPFAEVDAARKHAKQMKAKKVLLAGERNGQPIDGFDVGNSPAEFQPDVCKDHTIIFTTSNGTRAILHAIKSERILLAGFVNFSAIYEQLLHSTLPIQIVCAGFRNEISLEDTLLAGVFVETLMQQTEGQFILNDGARVAWDTYAGHGTWLQQACRISNGGLHLASLGYEQDIELAVQIDRYAIIPEVYNSPVSIEIGGIGTGTCYWPVD